MAKPTPPLNEPLIDDKNKKAEPEEKEGLNVPKIAGIALTVAVLVGAGFYKKDFVKAEAQQAWEGLKGLGYAACPIVCFLCWLLTTVSGPAFIVEVSAGGLFQSMFGMFPGAYVAMLTCCFGIWLGCNTAFFLGQRYLKEHVKDVIAKHEILVMVNEIIAEEGWKFAFLMRLNPLIPFELFNYAVAMTDISPMHNAIAALGTMPIVCFEVYGAASAADIAHSATSKEGGSDGSEKIKETLIKLAISAVLIGVVSFYGKSKYDAKVKEREDRGLPPPTGSTGSKGPDGLARRNSGALDTIKDMKKGQDEIRRKVTEDLTDKGKGIGPCEYAPLFEWVI